MMWNIDRMKPLSATVVLSFFIHTCLCFDATFRHGKSMSDKSINQNLNISLPASVMTGD